MNYKKIIKKRSTRQKILSLFSFVPDKQMIQLQYRIKFGRKLNLKEPSRFTEKLQWYKLYYRIPLMRQCADKAEVREYVRSCGLEEILVPLIGIYDAPSEIEFAKLPEQFVAKDTLGGGGNAVFICKDKKILQQINDSGNATGWDSLLIRMKDWTTKSGSYKAGGREWVYGGRRHRIIIEQYLPSDPEKGGLIDYKFFCFYGKPKITYVVADRKVGEKAGFGIFRSENYEKLSVVRCDENPLERDVPRPDRYDEMLRIAETLSAPFPEARVDLYCVEGRIYFGEITFFDGSGYMSFDPDEFDFQMGEMFQLPERRK